VVPEPVWRYAEANILHHTGTRIPTPRSSSPEPVAISTELPWLSCNICQQFHVYWKQSRHRHFQLHQIVLVDLDVIKEFAQASLPAWRRVRVAPP
jgi:hypothetical protein